MVTTARVSMSAVWDRTTEFLGDHIGAVAGIAGLTLFLPAAVQGALEPVEAAAQPGGTKVALAILFLVLSLTNLFGQVAVTALAIEPALGQRGAFARAAARFLPIIGISIVLGLGALLLILPPLVLLIADGVDFEAMSTGAAPTLSAGTGWLLALYGLLLMPLMIWVGTRLSVVWGVAVAERRGLGAIRRSWTLTRGAALRILGALILLTTVGLVAVLAAETVFGSILRLLFGAEGLVNVASVVTAVMVALVSAALSVVLSAFLAKVYVALTARAEAVVPA